MKKSMKQITFLYGTRVINLELEDKNENDSLSKIRVILTLLTENELTEPFVFLRERQPVPKEQEDSITLKAVLQKNLVVQLRPLQENPELRNEQLGLIIPKENHISLSLGGRSDEKSRSHQSDISHNQDSITSGWRGESKPEVTYFGSDKDVAKTMNEMSKKMSSSVIISENFSGISCFFVGPRKYQGYDNALFFERFVNKLKAKPTEIEFFDSKDTKDMHIKKKGNEYILVICTGSWGRTLADQFMFKMGDNGKVFDTNTINKLFVYTSMGSVAGLKEALCDNKTYPEEGRKKIIVSHDENLIFDEAEKVGASFLSIRKT